MQGRPAEHSAGAQEAPSVKHQAASRQMSRHGVKASRLGGENNGREGGWHTGLATGQRELAAGA